MVYMTQKRNVYLVQVNNSYGKNAFLPYSVGLLQSFALTNNLISDAYDFKGFVYLRESFEDISARFDKPDVVGISCYIWNWNYSISLAKHIKSCFPGCLIVLGGPHIPVRSDGFFAEHPYADLLVHYEGEITFSEILLERLQANPDYTKILGLSSKSATGETVKTESRTRADDLSIIPSPYLSGIFDAILENQSYDFHASQETHRGCPYSCTFCDWGSNTLAKIKAFDTDRLIEELYWFANRKIDLLYNCDANYGILPRDVELTERMAEIKKEYGFPNKFRAAYAKNSNETIYKIAKILNQAEMNKGITLSFQSMDVKTLEIVKRKNIKVTNFRELMRRYRLDGIATYSEIIIGLPGEIYDSFANGLELLIECGQHDSLQVYNCEVLPNSEMNDPEYKKYYDIRTACVPVLFFHGTPSFDPYQEHYELVIGTSTLSQYDWLKTHRFSWAVQCFHCLSLTQYIAVFLYKECGIKYREFYEKLLKFASANPQTLTGQITSQATNLFEGIAKGQEWGIIDERFGPIVWPPEEGAFLQIIVHKNQFYDELFNFTKELVPNADCKLLADVFEYQKNMIIDPFQPACFEFKVSHDLHEYFIAAFLGDVQPIVEKDTTYCVRGDKQYDGDLENYSKEVVWYGRKGGKFKHTQINEKT